MGHPENDIDSPPHRGEGETLQPKEHERVGKDGPRHDPQRHDGNRHQIGDQAVGDQAVEVVNGKRRGGESRDEGGQRNAQNIEHEPAGQAAISGPGAERGASNLVGGDQRDDRGKRQLEARPQQRLGAEQQDRRGGPSGQRHGNNSTIQHHGGKRDPGHEKGALRRDRRPGHHEIDEGGNEGRKGRPFLDWIVERDRRHQGEEPTCGKEDNGGEQAEVKARDRQQMGEPGIPHRGEIGFGDGAGGSWNGLPHPGADGMTQRGDPLA